MPRRKTPGAVLVSQTKQITGGPDTAIALSTKKPRKRKTKPPLEPIDESRRIQFRNEIADFLVSSEPTMDLPPSLTKPERAYIHNYVAKMGLSSHSYGKGKKRYITIIKRANHTAHESHFEPLLNDQAQCVLAGTLEAMGVLSATDVALVDHIVTAPPASKKSGFSGVHTDWRLVPPRSRMSPSMKADCDKLPIAAYRNEILEAINREQVIIISGETGSGKTTQVPQYIMEECCERRVPCRIFCTQPRRIAAVTIAERVANERSEELGENVGFQIRLENNFRPTSNLIYATSGCFLRSLMNNTRQAFQGLTHLILDEVHERDKNTDFLLIALRDELVHNRKLKVLLMSATMNIDLLSNYFNGCRVIRVPGTCYETRTFFLEDVLFYLDYETNDMRRILDEMPPDECVESKVIPANGADEEMSQLDEDTRHYVDTLLAACHGERGEEDFFEQLVYLIEGEGVPVNVAHSAGKYTPLIAAAMRNNLRYLERFLARGADIQRKDMWGKTALDYARLHKEPVCVERLEACNGVLSPDVTTDAANEALSRARTLLAYQRQFLNRDDEEIDHNLLLNLILTIHKAEFSGSILVFLPGYSDMMAQRDLIEKALSQSSYSLLLIHSSMGTQDQRLAFQPCPVRKIILATNIAETSLTFPDVAYVIDTGRVKQNVFDSTTNSSYLRSVEISKACAKQRAGRAGRTQTGICYRLYSSTMYEAMTEFPIAELLRSPLLEICLYTKIICGEEVSIADYLAKALESPSKINILNAIQKLTMMGAIDKKENLTILGRRLADFPLDVQLGKCLLYAALLRCVDPVLTIVAYLSAKDPFLLPSDREERDRTSALRRNLADSSMSDHMGIVRLYHMWLKARRSRSTESQFLYKYNLSRSTLEMMLAVHRQILDHMKRTTLPSGVTFAVLNTNSNDWSMIRACLTAGLYPNVGRIKSGQNSKVRTQYEKSVNFHSSSVLRNASGPGSLQNQPQDLPTDWLIFSEKSRIGRRALLRFNTMVTPLNIALFCGDLDTARNVIVEEDNANDDDDDDEEEEYPSRDSQLLAVDDWIKFCIPKVEWTIITQFKDHLVNAFIGFLHAGQHWRPEQYTIVVDTLRTILKMDNKANFGDDECNVGLYGNNMPRSYGDQQAAQKPYRSGRGPKSKSRRF